MSDYTNTPEEDEAWAEAERRMDTIGQNGPTGAHYPAGVKYDTDKPMIAEYSCGHEFSVLAGDELEESCHEPGCKGQYVKARNTDMGAKGKQPRYQDAKGEDWIDEFARTATPEEFRGAMRFSIGKYNRRMGKKDELVKEIEKIRDYAERWLKVEKSR